MWSPFFLCGDRHGAKIRNLLKLGVQLGTSIRAGLNRGGQWAMDVPQAGCCPINKWLKDQDLVGWCGGGG